MAEIDDETDTHAYFSGSFDSIFSSISKNMFPLIIYMQRQLPVKGENDQDFPGIISPT